MPRRSECAQGSFLFFVHKLRSSFCGATDEKRVVFTGFPHKRFPQFSPRFPQFSCKNRFSRFFFFTFSQRVLKTWWKLLKTGGFFSHRFPSPHRPGSLAAHQISKISQSSSTFCKQTARSPWWRGVGALGKLHLHLLGHKADGRLFPHRLRCWRHPPSSGRSWRSPLRSCRSFFIISTSLFSAGVCPVILRYGPSPWRGCCAHGRRPVRRKQFCPPGGSAQA